VGITLVVSNIMAAVQFNVKRMMAYSGISHAGFLLATLLIPNFDINTLSFYVLVYGIASILSFVVIYAVQEQSQSNDLHAFKGLSKRNPALATALTLSLLSMAGIPPLAGFFSKYMVIAGIVNTYPVLAVVMVLTSVVGVYYYLKVIMTVYSAPDTDEVTSVNSFWLTVGGIALFALMALPAWL
jgi:NADH-quinone oxidoreductase subunit N